MRNPFSKIELGRRGEEQAVECLTQNGYRILSRNLRTKFGEIDVVAREGETLCFVEIKARSTARFGWPEEGVTREKQWRLARLASWYISRRRFTGPVRFDVVSILYDPKGAPARTRLIKGAFEAPSV